MAVRFGSIVTNVTALPEAGGSGSPGGSAGTEAGRDTGSSWPAGWGSQRLSESRPASLPADSSSCTCHATRTAAEGFDD